MACHSPKQPSFFSQGFPPLDTTDTHALTNIDWFHPILAVEPGDRTCPQSLDRAVRAWRKQRQAADVAAHEGESVFAIIAGSFGMQMRSIHRVQHRRVRSAV
jgi:hypothetical protein